MPLPNPFRPASGHSSLRDRAAKLKAGLARSAPEPTTSTTPGAAPQAHENLTAEILAKWAEWAATPESQHADELVCEERHALLEVAERLPATRESLVPKALALAWIEYVDLWKAGRPRSEYATDGRLALDIDAIAQRADTHTGDDRRVRPGDPSNSLVDMVDFASATMDELRAIRDTADLVGDVAHALSWQGRCNRQRGPFGYEEPNGAGRLMHWLGNALCDVSSAAVREAQRRAPEDAFEQATRLAIIAGAIIDIDDPDQSAALAHEIAAHAATEKAEV